MLSTRFQLSQAGVKENAAPSHAPATPQTHAVCQESLKSLGKLHIQKEGRWAPFPTSNLPHAQPWPQHWIHTHTHKHTHMPLWNHTGLGD